MSDQETVPLHTEKVKAVSTSLGAIDRPFLRYPKNETYAAIGDPEYPWAEAQKNLLEKLKEKLRPNPDFKSISPTHGRNMTEMVTSAKVLWGGTLPGDIYGARSLKGGRMDTPGGIKIEADSESYYGIHAWGLMDDGCLPRVVAASELMRKNGLPTECPREVKKIKDVWLKTTDPDGNVYFKKVSIKKWEKDELKRIQDEANEADDYTKPDKIKSAQQTEEYLKRTEFIVLERDLQVDERLIDLAEAARNNKLKDVLKPVLKWLNVATQAKNSGLIPGTARPQKFDAENSEDVQEYLTKWLPSQMGIYLGKFHTIGLTHQFLHNQNWSAVGTIYDLDSVKGKSLFSGDKIPTDEDLTVDIYDSLNDINSLILHDLPDTDEFKGVDIDDLAVEASYQFLKNYIKEKYGTTPPEMVRKEIETADSKQRRSSYATTLERAWSKLIEESQAER